MSGLKLVIPTNFTDLTLPILRDDPLLTTGSLILIDPTHPARPMAAGVPASGGVVPNIAWAEAAAAIGGSPAQASLDSSLTYAGLTGTKGVLERSSKGGIHGIVSQAVALASGDGGWIALPAALRVHLFNNNAHRFYMSFWDRLTRINAGSVNTNGCYEVGIAAASSGSVLAGFTPAFGPFFGVGAVPTGRVVPAINTAGIRFGSLQTVANGAVSTGGAGYAGGHIWGAPAGSYNAALLASRNNYWPSQLAYRFYLEDLTVSGRTYAQVDALDYAEYTKQVLTAGGRYFGDTFTDPATIA